MLGILVITHGMLASVLVETARKIVGGLEHIRPISIGWDDNVDDARESIRRAIEESDHGQGVLILTDMFGGTPTNISLTFLETGRTEIVTGVNLPMIIKLATIDDKGLGDVVVALSSQGQKSIYVASDGLTKQES